MNYHRPISIRCGSCTGRHGSAYAVKVCHQLEARVNIMTNVGTLDWSGPNEDNYGEDSDGEWL